MAQLPRPLFLGRLKSSRDGRKMGSLVARLTQSDLVSIRVSSAEGRIRPSIDRQYSFAEVPEAIRLLEGGHPLGNLVLKVAKAGHAA